MKKLIHSLVKSLIICGIVSILLVLVGLLLKWKSTIQFSNAFFWAGAILVVFGVLSIFGGYGMRSNFGVIYSQSAGDMNILERTKQWIADTEQSYSIYILLLFSGVVLMLISVLIGEIFKPMG
ncbi:MAG TPA: hypothetical protein PK883_09555 [Anaerolineaceae bacterium]|nr:hypothetical protein [Anaerolineaceae bacterium]